ncbi:MAG: type II toxin-antitoxin system RelE family toxin [Caldilinea sp.]
MYRIEFSEAAERDLKWYSRREQNIILDGIKTNLRNEPTTVTLNRKPCRREPGQLADWELRIGVYRVYYNVDEVVQVVAIERIGDKPNNVVFLRGRS